MDDLHRKRRRKKTQRKDSSVLSIRFDTNHIAYLEALLQKHNHEASSLANIVKDSTILALNVLYPNWIHEAPPLTALTRIQILKERRKNPRENLLTMANKIGSTHNTPHIQPVTSPTEYDVIPTVENTAVETQTTTILTDSEKLKHLEQYTRTVFISMPTDIQVKAQNVWANMTVEGGPTIEENLNDENPQLAKITALILKELVIHDPELLTPEQKQRVMELTSMP